MGNVYRQETTHITDNDTGEIRRSETVESAYIESEPPFVKIYIEDVCALNRVPKSQQDVLYHLIKKLDYEGYITISTRYRQQICEALDIKPQTLSNKIQALCKSGLIKVVSKNEYEANPYFFGRGSWVDIYNRRRKGDFSITIKYTSDGKKEFSTTSKSTEEMDLSLQ